MANKEMFNILSHNRNEIKITLRFYLTLSQWLSSRIQTTINAVKDRRKELVYTVGGNVN
jgi:hypothetical protein